jgi:hypothetical protein
LRGEAIHFAQADPVLLDVVAVLDFPEWADFHEMLMAYGLPELPRLQLAIAKDLNQAYAEEQPLEENLLPRHRRLALLRAPVAERLQVMRQIAKLDKNNPVWEDDIRLFEAARLREIQTAMAGPAKGDAARIDEFARELSQPGWLTPTPTALAKQVGKQAALLSRERALLELGTLVEQLNTAMDAADVALALTLRDRYEQLEAQAQLAANEPLARQAARPLKWLAQREKSQIRELEVQTALAALEDALARRADPEEAARLHDEVLRLVRALPARLEDRYQTYIHRTNATRRWREKLILLLVFFIGFLLLVGLIGFLMLKSRNRHSASVVNWLAVSRPAPTPDNCPPTRIDPLRGNCNG